MSRLIDTQILPPTDASLTRVEALLSAGECVALPSETVYGLAANALDTAACQRIFAIKGRPLIDPLIVHCRDLDQVATLADPPPELSPIAAAFWPGPLTVVLRKRDIVPDIVTAGLPSVALRIPAQPLLLGLLRKLDFPLAAPSANPFGYVSPTRATHVAATLNGKIAAILDGGPCAHGLESTILDLRDPANPRILRPGPVTSESLQSVLQRPIGEGKVASLEQATSSPQAAPGMLARHYSPQRPLAIRKLAGIPNDNLMAPTVAYIHWQRPTPIAASPNHFWLSENGDSAEAARNLFDLIQRVDRPPFESIIVETPPAGLPLSAAIHDRLTRAAAKRN